MWEQGTYPTAAALLGSALLPVKLLRKWMGIRGERS